MTSASEIAAWLADAGLRNMPLEEIVDDFSRRLNEAGVPVTRTFVGMNTLHPMVRARSMIWDRAAPEITHFEFSHAGIDVQIIRESPFMPMLRDGVTERRCDLTDVATVKSVPMFEELHTAGMTEWLGRIFPMGELVPQVGWESEAEHAEQLALVCSLTTDRPGGFSEADLAVLKQTLPVFALAVKAVTMRTLGHGLLAAYLGDDPASRVFAGTVQRGEVQSVEAVLFFTDLRGFTAIADTTPGKELITLLDECFECMVAPVARHGGEVLKFMGDGLLAAFAVILDERAEVCAAALEAAEEVLALVDALNAERRKAGKPAAGLDISLHIGRVLYGNVGTAQRLDFTVIGPAVNEASRIEKLCEPLGQSLLVSQAFAEAATASRRCLVSLGRHRLRGVREETELFALGQAAKISL
ncbi:MAG: adenylate/guanylate cyclase domain-containing protein [Reyranella sp.]|uniref:adenylate/guanylate cyclase domain-containing protein n=1 Tax=Reyranella sp. TaxID=1929291 RepID=UPI0027320B71|nr:adenylate/guanylate cyclase domain-containing protein [Reyranella sp.]MDP1962539.1 adenylate/guanylate cyclase domain-containing protein [Reyranella sp.]MDP2373383.1 adenylate/guanylate cyclase domain-containing protein [Reyranella sp.]